MDYVLFQRKKILIKKREQRELCLLLYLIA